MVGCAGPDTSSTSGGRRRGIALPSFHWLLCHHSITASHFLPWVKVQGIFSSQQPSAQIYCLMPWLVTGFRQFAVWRVIWNHDSCDLWVVSHTDYFLWGLPSAFWPADNFRIFLQRVYIKHKTRAQNCAVLWLQRETGAVGELSS